MRLAYEIMLLAAGLTTASIQAGGADQPLTPSARRLLNAAGLAPETYLRATQICKRNTANVGGLDGTVAVDSGSFDCRGGSSDVDKPQLKTVLWMAFQSNIPVTRCISFERAGDYLLGHGWRRVPDRTGGHVDLMPITVDFIDGAGATLTLAPYLHNTCLTNVSLKIETAAATH